MSIKLIGLATALMIGMLVAGCQLEAVESTGPPAETSTIQELPLPEESTPVQPSAFTPTTSVQDTSSPEVADPSPAPETGSPAAAPPPEAFEIMEFAVPSGSRPHDVAPAPDGTVWYTAQGSGELGRLDPATGATHHIPLGSGSAPHGVIVGPDGAPWITDSGLNAIVRVDPQSEAVETFPLPESTRNANLNTAAFDGRGILWFTGQNGYYGRLDPITGELEVYEAPRGRGPYGISATPQGEIYFASLAGSYLGQVDLASGEATVLQPLTADQGARRVWADSTGMLWISEWNAGQLGRYDPVAGEWQEWRLPGERPQPYAVYVDEWDQIWLSDFGANALVRFDPALQTFDVFTLPSAPANVRQILGRPGEVWGAESGVDQLVVIRITK
jgi:virginiamycin B lyase